MRKPDAPYSLFGKLLLANKKSILSFTNSSSSSSSTTTEGLAGVCYAYIDMLNPDSTFFPAYEFPFSFDAITS